MSIDRETSHSVLLFGYDINAHAVRIARKALAASGAKIFSNLEELKRYLSVREDLRFGLTIYDRVLYLMTDDEVRAHVEDFRMHLRYVIIDDFHSEDPYQPQGYPYKAKNYLSLFKGFAVLDIQDSGHVSKDSFMLKTARRLILINEALDTETKIAV